MPAGNAKFLMDSVFELAQRINRFRLADAEIGLFCAVVIITAGEFALSPIIQTVSKEMQLSSYQIAPAFATLKSLVKCSQS